jgi:hypothetical protein
VKASLRTQLLILVALTIAAAVSIGLQVDPGYRSPPLTKERLATAEAIRRLMCSSGPNAYTDCNF